MICPTNLHDVRDVHVLLEVVNFVHLDFDREVFLNLINESYRLLIT